MRRRIASIVSVLFVAILAFPTIAYASEKDAAANTSVKIAGEPYNTFMIPPEIKANMSKEKLYELQAIPGYFKPLQVSPPKSLLLDNPQPVKALVIVDEEMLILLSLRMG